MLKFEGGGYEFVNTEVGLSLRLCECTYTYLPNRIENYLRIVAKNGRNLRMILLCILIRRVIWAHRLLPFSSNERLIYYVFGRFTDVIRRPKVDLDDGEYHVVFILLMCSDRR